MGCWIIAKLFTCNFEHEEHSLRSPTVFEDKDNVIIKIYNIGGLGKMTLLKEINSELFQTTFSKFDLMIFVTVSKDVRIDLIQEKIGE